MDIFTSIDEIIAYAKEKLMLDELDVDFARNGILAVAGLGTYRAGNPDIGKAESEETPDRLIKAFTDECVKAGTVSADKAERVGAAVMELVSLKPSQLNDMYFEAGGADSKKARDFLADYVKASGFGKSSNPAFVEEVNDEGVSVRATGDGKDEFIGVYLAIDELIAYAQNNLLLDEFDTGKLTENTELPFDAVTTGEERTDALKGAYWSDAVGRYAVVDKSKQMFLLDEDGVQIGGTITLKSYGGMKVTSVTGDDKYIYVAYSVNNQTNVPFDIYTWDGVYVGTGSPEGIHLRQDVDGKGTNQPYNIQAIFFHEGEMYTTFCSWTNDSYSGSTGLYLWKMKALNDPLTKPYLESIEVTGELVKKEYIAGEKFDPTGLVVTAYYNDGSSVPVELSACTFSPQSLVNEGEQMITINYADGNNVFGDTVSVTVLPPTPLGDYIVDCAENETEPAFNVAPSKGDNGLAINNGTGYTMGGVSDGEYIYISQNSGGNAVTRVHKIDPDTYEILATSATFETGIGESSLDNSRLFIKDGKLYCVVTGRVVRSIELSAFTDGCSLDIDETLPFNNVSGDLIDAEYNGTLQKYAVLSAQTLSLLDGEGNPVKQITLSGNKPSEQASQNPSSIASDDKYIYVSHKLNNQNDVLILVYDWEGNFVGSCAPSGIRLTSEGYNTQSIFIHNGVVYATLCTWTNTAGVYVWTISFSA